MSIHSIPDLVIKNANVITIGSRLTKKSVALRCVDTFLKTTFQGGRHLRRIKKI